MAPDSSDAAGVKHQTSHEGHKGDNGAQRMNENEIAKQILDAAFLVHTKLGLLINFGEAHLKNGIKRVINGQLDAAAPLEVSL